MIDKLVLLKERLNEIADLKSSQALLFWDQETYMPRGGASGRGFQIGTLAKIAHEKFTSDEIGQLLEDIEPAMGQLHPESTDACLIRVTIRKYDKSKRVPSSWVEENSRLTSIAFTVWEEAKANSNLGLFRPYLEQIVTLRRQYANFFQPYEHIYDPLLDDYEPGLKTTVIQAVFEALRQKQVALLHAISEKPDLDNSFLRKVYPINDQLEFGKEVITKFGFDWKHGRQDLSTHPFTTSFHSRDVRLTTRVNPNIFETAIFGTMHEAGHALYEQGIDPLLDRTPVSGGASMAVHESQSRLWENLVGRSLPFWKYYYPRLQQLFPSQLENINLDSFYRGINRVKPGLIRVEADEASYNLHIMLRFELEINLLEGSLQVADLSEAWNNRMKEFLGTVPSNDSEGLLQDVHWSQGDFGYFATYALGNLISAQLWETILRDCPQTEENISQGNFSPLLEWLREKIHKHGSKFEPDDLIRRTTGSDLSAEPYLRYLKTKYSEIYHL